MEINQTSTALANANTVTPPARPEISSDFETFLKMLTVQLENQDPLNPTEAADYAVQLATFSGVEQQVKTNDLLRDLSGSFGAAGLADLANWVGKEARSSAPVAINGAPVTLYPEVADGADRAELIVRGDGDEEVGRLSIDPKSDPFEWAGVTADGFPFPPGNYTFEVVSYAGELEIGTSPASVYNKVTEVRLGAAGETFVVFEGGAEALSAEITAIRNAS